MHSSEQGPSKKRILDNEEEKNFLALCDYMKANNALELLEKNKGEYLSH